MRAVRAAGESARELVLLVGCLAVLGCDPAVGTGPRNPVGTVVVSVYTAGVEIDGDGYQVRIGNGESQGVAANGTVTFEDMPAGRLTLALEEVAVTCDAEGGEVRNIDVVANQTVDATVAVWCTSKPVVFASAREGDWHLYRMNEDGTGARRIGPRGYAPRWSPDGTRILFTTQVAWGGANELHVMNADGSHVRRLTEGYGGSWSPDGARIVFSRWGEEGAYGAYLYVMPENGGGVTRLTDRIGDAPDWGPDGRIAFKEWELGGDGMIHGSWLSVSGGDGREVTRILEADAGEPAWSPDGTRLAFSVWGPEGPVLFTVGADGQEPKQRTAAGLSEAQPRWSRDGNHLIFTSFHGAEQERSDVRMGSPDGGQAVPVSLFVVDDRWADIRPTL